MAPENAGEDVEKLDLSQTAGGDVKFYSHYGNNLGNVLKKLKKKNKQKTTYHIIRTVFTQKPVYDFSQQFYLKQPETGTNLNIMGENSPIISGWLNKVVHTYHGIELSNTKEQIINTINRQISKALY